MEKGILIRIVVVIMLQAWSIKGDCQVDSLDYVHEELICDTTDTAFTEESSIDSKVFPQKNIYKFKPAQLIIPSTLIGIGIVGLESDWLKWHNKEVRDEMQESNHGKLSIDDFLQYTPSVATYGLNLCGMKGRHDYGDYTIILGTAYVLMALTVNPLKSITKVERPDASARNSFPSGHTATAFMGAELLRREYWDVSPWIGVAGYAVATTTGIFRMYNNRHWLTDVIAGAGIGILSAQAAYWLYPFIAKTLCHKKFFGNTSIMPYMSGNDKGVCCTFSF